MNRILPHKDKIHDSALIQENTVSEKPVFSPVLCKGDDRLALWNLAESMT